MRGRLPAHAASLLGELAELVGAQRLQLFGGAALDLLNDPGAICQDLDLAIPTGELPGCLSRLRTSPEITHLSDARHYRIRHHIPVVMISAVWKDSRRLDLNFFDQPDAAGHFDLECVRWQFPGNWLTDPHHVTNTPAGSVRLVTGVHADNPILLLNRLVRLCSKYGIDLNGPDLAPTIGELVELARQWDSTDYFHGQLAHDAHLRSLFAATHRSKAEAKFLHGCVQSGVLTARLPTLHDALSGDHTKVSKLASATGCEQFWLTADQLVNDPSQAWRTYPSTQKAEGTLA